MGGAGGGRCRRVSSYVPSMRNNCIVASSCMHGFKFWFLTSFLCGSRMEATVAVMATLANRRSRPKPTTSSVAEAARSDQAEEPGSDKVFSLVALLCHLPELPVFKSSRNHGSSSSLMSDRSSNSVRSLASGSLDGTNPCTMSAEAERESTRRRLATGTCSSSALAKSCAWNFKACAQPNSRG